MNPSELYAPGSAARPGFAVSAQGAGPLTPLQKRSLAALARKAYAVQKRLGLADEPFDEWRHAAVSDAAPGRPGLTCLTQADYAAVRDWLMQLSGAESAGAAGSLREADEIRRARFALDRECRARAAAFEGGAAGAKRYAEKIVVARSGAAGPTAGAIWQAIFTLRARAVKRVLSASAAPDGENHVRAARRVFPRFSRAGIGLTGGTGDGR